MIFGQLRPGEVKGGCATTYGGCLVAPIGVLCLVVYRLDLLRRSVCSACVEQAGLLPEPLRNRGWTLYAFHVPRRD
jgi:hypothetical protein